MSAQLQTPQPFLPEGFSAHWFFITFFYLVFPFVAVEHGSCLTFVPSSPIPLIDGAFFSLLCWCFKFLMHNFGFRLTIKQKRGKWIFEIWREVSFLVFCIVPVLGDFSKPRTQPSRWHLQLGYASSVRGESYWGACPLSVHGRPGKGASPVQPQLQGKPGSVSLTR